MTTDNTRHATSPYVAAADDLRTIRDLLRFAVTEMGRAGVVHGHGFPDATTEAIYLLAWFCHIPHGALSDHLDARLTRTERAGFLSLLERRVVEREPVPYLTGEAWIGDFRFFVDRRVLIPRSFIGDLLLEGLSPWVPDLDAVDTALDLCTGSGCLAILMAHAFPNAAVDAADLSPAAIDVAHRNVGEYGCGDRVHLVQSDLFAALAGKRYDVIVSNPPYVDAPSMAELPREFRHEPELALAAGDDGLDLVRRILAEAGDHLNPAGVLIVEIGHNRAALEAAYPDTPFTWLSTHAGDDFVFLLGRDQLPT